MSESNLVRTDVDGAVATVTIDRQDKLNALNADVIAALGEAFDGLRHRDDVRGVILTGAGEKAFVAGADIEELSKMTSLSAVDVSRDGQDVFRDIEQFPKPVLAAVGGYALGGGCELALACHMRIASDNARFGLPEVGLGIVPGYGGTIRLARLIGLGRAIEITLTGDMVSAERAEAIGLVSAVVPRADLMERAGEMMVKIASKAPVAVRLALESVYRAQDTTLAEALGFESSMFGLLTSTSDMKEGMQAFLEKRKPTFEGR